MHISFDKNPDSQKLAINTDKIFKETFKGEDLLLLFIIEHMHIITKIKGATIIIGTLTTTALATTAIIAASYSLFITVGLMILLFFSACGACAYGIASLFDMAILNRKKFVDSVIDQIIDEASSKVEDMEDQVLTEIIAKASMIPGLEGFDAVVNETNQRTGENRIKKVVRARREKKPIKN